MHDVFISYSRVDSIFALKLADALALAKRDVWIDREDIRMTAEWWAEIRSGIEGAENVLVLLSPELIGSPVCHMEIEHARNLGKRIIYLNHRPFTRDDAAQSVLNRLAKDVYVNTLIGDRNPMILFETNWKALSASQQVMFPYDTTRSERFRKGEAETDDERAAREAEDTAFDVTFERLRAALDLDLAHVRQHTRLLQRATEWHDSKQEAALLLYGEEVADAEGWLTGWDVDAKRRAESGESPKQPEPLPLQRDYIAASRAAEDVRLLRDAQRERSIRNFRRAALVLGIVGALALVAVLIAIPITLNSLSSNATAQAQVATADVALVTATQVAQQVATADNVLVTATAVVERVSTGEARENALGTDIARAGVTLTAVPPMLTYAAQALDDSLIQQDIALQMANAFISLLQNNPRDALLLLDNLVQAYPDQQLAYQSRGLVLDLLNENDAALSDLNTAVSLNPQNEQNYVNRGILLNELGRYDDALADFNAALTLVPGLSVAYLNRGFAHLSLGEFEEAIADYSLVQEGMAGYVEALYQRAIAYVALDRYAEALADLDHAIEIEPDYADAFALRGAVRMFLGQVEEGYADWESAEALGITISQGILDTAQFAFQTLTAVPTPRP
jgi:Tfp pilus assembly protein PilF